MAIDSFFGFLTNPIVDDNQALTSDIKKPLAQRARCWYSGAVKTVWEGSLR